MGILNTLRRAITDPRLAAWKLNSMTTHHLLHRLRPPTSVFDEDWDNLVILDACRSDLLTENRVQDGQYETVWSGGSNSEAFLEYNIGDRTLDDVVYITANPWVSDYHDSVFRVIDAWESAWSDEHNTVLPGDLATLAREAAEEFPNKRLVVHFMQPHYPFLGPTAETLPDHRTFTGGGRVTTDGADSIWELLRRGEVSKAAVWRAYAETLDVVLPVARSLIEDLDGKSVLTADHGNAFGERALPIPIRTYGHQRGNHIRAMSEVPWITFDGGNRRTIESGSLHDDGVISTDVVEDRLKHLGYA